MDFLWKRDASIAPPMVPDEREKRDVEFLSRDVKPILPVATHRIETVRKSFPIAPLIVFFSFF